MNTISYAGYRFPPEIIHQAIWLYPRFTLSLRDVEDLLAERGIGLSYESIRRWVNHFGPLIADLRKRLPRPLSTVEGDELRAPLVDAVDEASDQLRPGSFENVRRTDGREPPAVTFPPRHERADAGACCEWNALGMRCLRARRHVPNRRRPRSSRWPTTAS